MDEAIHILVTGGRGQVGTELRSAAWPAGVVVHAPTRDEVDLENATTLRAMFAAIPFAAVINSGAYTAVDKAEQEVALAFGTNAMGPAVLAEVTRQTNTPLIQVSTDYVFDGAKQSPYVEDDPVGPLGVYGASKLAGELAVLTGNPRSLVLRTAWVVSPHRTNFLKTMLRLAANRPSLQIVDDQIGCPTTAHDIANALVVVAMKMITDLDAPTGVYHFVNSGETTWAGFAREILRLSRESGGPHATVDGIPTTSYPTPARRPANSRLATERLSRDYGVVGRSWESAIADVMADMKVKGLEF